MIASIQSFVLNPLSTSVEKANLRDFLEIMKQTLQIFRYSRYLIKYWIQNIRWDVCNRWLYENAPTWWCCFVISIKIWWNKLFRFIIVDDVNVGFPVAETILMAEETGIPKISQTYLAIYILHCSIL